MTWLPLTAISTLKSVCATTPFGVVILIQCIGETLTAELRAELPSGDGALRLFRSINFQWKLISLVNSSEMKKRSLLSFKHFAEIATGGDEKVGSAVSCMFRVTGTMTNFDKTTLLPAMLVRSDVQERA